MDSDSHLLGVGIAGSGRPQSPDMSRVGMEI